ncbi:MAG: hypothetical protein KC491_01060 [Dehalococcoidia bacterium]|nr:hypothetical protein [Dehalococcoidia bacterium]
MSGEMAFWSDPQAIGDLYVGGGDVDGSEMAAVFGAGWVCLLTAGEARQLAAALVDIADAITGVGA